MSELSDYAEDEIVDHLLGKGLRDFTSPAALYVALLTAVGADSQTGSTITEPTTGGYARKAVTFAASSGGSAAMSDASLSWTNTAATVWDVVGIAIVDALTVGNMIAFDNDMADASVVEDATFELTNLTFTLD
jgi:hypothetical protein